MLFKKGLLSDEDIKREIGKNIIIHPFKEKNIRGASINLSVSKMAWLKDGEIIISAYDKKKDSIIIPPKKTVLIETNEIIYVSRIIGGTFHSKVGVVTKGLGHIGTTLDPGWIGNCLITIHNHSYEKVELEVGETFISLKLFYVNTISKFVNNNVHGRPELLGKNLTEDEKKFFDEDIRTNIMCLKKVFYNSPEYILFKRSRESKLYKKIFLSIGVIIAGLITSFLIYILKNSIVIEYITIISSLLAVITSTYLTILITKISNKT